MSEYVGLNWKINYPEVSIVRKKIFYSLFDIKSDIASTYVLLNSVVLFITTMVIYTNL